MIMSSTMVKWGGQQGFFPRMRVAPLTWLVSSGRRSWRNTVGRFPGILPSQCPETCHPRRLGVALVIGASREILTPE